MELLSRPSRSGRNGGNCCSGGDYLRLDSIQQVFPEELWEEGKRMNCGLLRRIGRIGDFLFIRLCIYTFSVGVLLCFVKQIAGSCSALFNVSTVSNILRFNELQRTCCTPAARPCLSQQLFRKSFDGKKSPFVSHEVLNHNLALLFFPERWGNSIR